MEISSKASRRLAEDGTVWEGNFTTLWANPSFQAAGSSTDSPATACPDSQKVPELLGQRSDANEQLPAGTSVKQLKEEAERPQMGARG